MTMVSLAGGDTDMSALVQEDVMCNGKETVEVQGERAGAVTFMEF